VSFQDLESPPWPCNSAEYGVYLPHTPTLILYVFLSCKFFDCVLQAYDLLTYELYSVAVELLVYILCFSPLQVLIVRFKPGIWSNFKWNSICFVPRN